MQIPLPITLASQREAEISQNLCHDNFCCIAWKWTSVMEFVSSSHLSSKVHEKSLRGWTSSLAHSLSKHFLRTVSVWMLETEV